MLTSVSHRSTRRLSRRSSWDGSGRRSRSSSISACGLTVVTIGIEELQNLLPGSVARFYDAGDIRGFADVLEAMASRPDVIRQARDESRQLAESRYSWHQQARAVEGVLAAASAGRVTSSRR